jgi:hypothetical protein
MTEPAAAPGNDALARLAQSRTRLLAALQQDAAPAAGTATPGSGDLAPWSGAAWLLDLLRGAWRQQPWQAAAGAAALAARELMRPLARRHPLLLVLGAALAGVALVQLRPARRLLRPALWAGVMPQVVRAVLARWPGPSPAPVPPP